ncbi:MAG: hypothetical protein L0H19_00840 [Salinisphaera sp.]|nr:hypothetical protein [Salinisphaera sp.]
MKKTTWWMAATAAGLMAAGGLAQAANDTGDSMEMDAAGSMEMGWFGGPVYTGDPALKVTAALVAAGGGAQDFSFPQALASMLGQETVNAEVAKLTKQYGQEDVQNFLDGMTYAVRNSLAVATAQGVTLPTPPADLKGVKLAKTLVHAGTAPDGVWWSGWLFDSALSHPIHLLVMANVEAKHSRAYDKNIHRILNQAMYDVAQALKIENVKLASTH